MFSIKIAVGFNRRRNWKKEWGFSQIFAMALDRLLAIKVKVNFHTFKFHNPLS
jgi:hypothetical protein